MSRKPYGEVAARGRRTPEQPCLNCGDATHGNYCRNCGQAKQVVAVSVKTLVMDVLEDQLVLSRALPRTLLYLVARPGLLTAEYVRGRVVRYIAPFRLYLATSVVFFLLLSFYGLRALDRVDAVQAQVRAAADTLLAGAEPGGLPVAIDTLDLSPDDRQQLSTVLERFGLVNTESSREAGLATGRSPGREDGYLQPWARGFAVGLDERSGVLARAQSRVLQRYGHLPPAEAIRQFSSSFLDYVPHVVFVLLPMFALILKLLYIRRDRFYAEHFVFALHVHAFVFLMFILMFAIGRAAVNVYLVLWMLIYLWLAMKRVYGQGFFRTTIKYSALGFTYCLLLTFALTVTGALALLL